MRGRGRVHHPGLARKVVPADVAAAMIGPGATVGMSGLTGAGYPKEVPLALAQRISEANAVLRGLLGVDSDLDRGPAPAIQQVLPSARFDAAALFREWAALDGVLELARRLAIGKEVPSAELGTYAVNALTLRALRGQLRARALQTASR